MIGGVSGVFFKVKDLSLNCQGLEVEHLQQRIDFLDFDAELLLDCLDFDAELLLDCLDFDAELLLACLDFDAELLLECLDFELCLDFDAEIAVRLLGLLLGFDADFVLLLRLLFLDAPSAHVLMRSLGIFQADVIYFIYHEELFRINKNIIQTAQFHLGRR